MNVFSGSSDFGLEELSSRNREVLLKSRRSQRNIPPVGGTNEKTGVDSALEDARMLPGKDGEGMVLKAEEIESHIQSLRIVY